MVRDRLKDSPFAAEPKGRVVLSGGASQLTEGFRRRPAPADADPGRGARDQRRGGRGAHPAGRGGQESPARRRLAAHVGHHPPANPAGGGAAGGRARPFQVRSRRR